MSSSESSSDSESEEQPKTIVQPVVTKNKDDSDSGSDSDSDSSSEEQPVVKATPVKEESDSDSDSESSSEEKKTAPVKKVAVPVATEDSDSDSDSDSSEEEQKTAPVKKEATPAQEDDSSDSDSDSEEEPKKTAPVVAAKKEESDDSDSSSDEEEETKPTKQAPPAEDDGSDSSSDEEEQPAKKKTVETEEVEEKETEEDLYKSTIQKDVKMTSLFGWNLTEIKAKGKKRKLENAKTPQVSKKLKAEKPVKAEKAESAPSSNKDFTITKEFNEYDFKNAHLKDISKCVFVKGISTNCYEKDIYEFFTDIEKPLDVRHRYFEDRAGIAFVNFSSAAAASKAVIDKNNEYIKDRWVNTDWAEEKKKSVSSNRGPKNIHMKDQTNRVWMGNLHREVTEDAVVELFKEIGELTDVFIIGRDESRPKIAYVSFTSNEEATKAVEELQGSSFLDNTLRLDWAEPRRNNDGGSGGAGGRGRKRRNEALSEKEEGTVTVFVGRLSDQATEESLTEHFKDCGEISQIRWVEKDGEFKGVAFVEFADTSMTDEAVKLNGTSYAGREIRVDYAKNNKRRKQEW